MILDHVSQSQVDMWQRCPKQWEYRYVHGLKVPPSGALVEGRCYHETLEHNFRQKMGSQEDLPIEECLDMFSTAWDATLLEEELIIWERLDSGATKDEGIGLVREYMSTVSPIVQPKKVEETYVSEVAGVKFVRVIDLVDVLDIVVDHKTSGKSYTQDDVDKSLEASASAFALERPIIFYNHVAIKTRIPKIQLIKTYRTQTDIDWWVDMVARIALQMKSGIAPPRPTGWWCSLRFCGYYEQCRGECARSYL